MESAMRSSEGIVEGKDGWIDPGDGLGTELGLPEQPRAVIERYRLVAARLDARLQPAPGEGRIVVVSSAEAGDGKTTAALELARAFAERLGRRVLLVDAARRVGGHRPGLTARLGATPAHGLADLLGGTARLGDSLLRLEPAGGRLHFAAQDEEGIATIVRGAPALRRRYDVVVYDTPALGESADASLLARGADGVVLVVRHAVTRKRALRLALDALVDAPLLGAVLVDHDGPTALEATARSSGR